MADDQQQQLEQAGRLSVQKQRDSYFFGGSIFFGVGYENFGNSLPSVYDPRRQYILNRIDSYPQNNMWQGALARITHKVAGTSAEISGKRRVKWYQDLIFFNADNGAGFEQFVTKVIHDFCVYDDGAVVEIIGRGEPDTLLDKEAIVGIAVLDPLRCFFTMNREFPVWYQDSVSGKMHKLHYSRVHRFVDQPLSDPELRGRGRSALSRAIGFVQQAIVNQSYIGEMLSDEPPPGILHVQGIGNKTWEDAWNSYLINRTQKGNTAYKPLMELISNRPTLNGEGESIEIIRFANAPEGYDPIALTELQAKGIALGLDIDPNDVLPMSTSQFGNGEQSKVLDQKNRDGGFTHLLKMLERFFNARVLPDPLRYQWRYRDSEQSLQSAEIAEKHLNVASTLVTILGASTQSKELALRYLADNVDSLGQILTDENGEMVSLYDDDPGTDDPTAQQIATDIDVEDAPTQAGEQTAQDDVTVPAGGVNAKGKTDTYREYTSNQIPHTSTQTYENPFFAVKDLEDVRHSFTRDFAAVIIDANNGDIASRRRAGTILRSVLTKHGRQATIEGLKTGGVEAEILEGDDLDTFLKWSAEQSGYVTNLTARIWNSGLTEAQIYSSVESWASKSLASAYQNGLMSADANGMYQWELGATEKHCDTCARLNKQVHRLKDWVARDLKPGSSKLDCGGWRCDCSLSKTTGRAKGRY